MKSPLRFSQGRFYLIRYLSVNYKSRLLQKPTAGWTVRRLCGGCGGLDGGCQEVVEVGRSLTGGVEA